MISTAACCCSSSVAWRGHLNPCTAVVSHVQATVASSVKSARQEPGGKAAGATGNMLCCRPCKLGLRCGWTADTCALCPCSPGGSQYEPRPRCEKCPEDTVGGQAGASSPQQCGGCRPGTGGLRCDECPPGTFSEGARCCAELSKEFIMQGCNAMTAAAVSFLLQVVLLSLAHNVVQIRSLLKARQAGTSACAR